MSKEIGKEKVFSTPSEFKCSCTTQVGIERVNFVNKIAFREELKATEAEVNQSSRQKKNMKTKLTQRRRAER